MACAGALTVGGGYLYWLSDVTDDEELYRLPLTGGAPEKMPLEVGGWYHLDWTDGYLIGSHLTGNRRGRPEQPTHESLGTSGHLASFDPEHMSVEDRPRCASRGRSSLLVGNAYPS